ncbi:MAG: hypothetical protein CMM56_01870 [Rhodospirillaceae bacterium]|nr:hypothetical protein [Rhodospirillaceae bacterium]
MRFLFQTKMKFRHTFCYLLFVLLIACTAPSYRLPAPTNENISSAINEINSASLRPTKSVSMPEARAIIERVMEQLKPKAQSMCNDLSERSSASCRNWQVTVEENNEFNAYATGSDKIVIYKGIIEQTLYIDEVALVLAHELSHHILNHINESSTNILVGRLVGAVLGAVIAGDVDTGANAGGYIANQTYSVAQESEADLIAIHILSAANFNLTQAREVILHMAKNNEDARTRSSFFDTHPVGPERLAQFDNAIKELQTKSTSSL